MSRFNIIVMHTFDQLLTLCESKIENLNFQRSPHSLYTPIEYTLSNSGKRMRPVALLMSANIFSDSIEDAINAAMSIEVFHNFTLLHDDIMDNASTRRGKPTVHVKWDANSAILSGDAMVIYSYTLLAQSKPEHLTKLLPVFNELSLGVCEGQQYDMMFEKMNNVTIEEYLNMIRLKTSVMIAGAMKMGAICGSANEEQADLMYNIGLNLGMAFQIQDDMLDTYGNSENFGKKVGGDILEAKKTYLYLTAINSATEEDRSLLDSLLHSEIEPDIKIESVRTIYNKYLVKELAIQKINSYFLKVEELLASLNVSSERKEPIKTLINYILLREK